MNLDHYKFETGENSLDFEFYSDGPKGKIKKVARFTKVKTVQAIFYNLDFGDWDEEEKKVDHFIVSDNKDAERVLRTVALLVLKFTEHHPDVFVYVQGSTPSRTRRYQMGVNKYWNEIEPLFDIFGLIKGQGFTSFQKGINYGAFLIRRKKQ